MKNILPKPLPFLEPTPLLAEFNALWEPYHMELRKRTFHKNDLLFLRGDPARKFWLMLSGWVKLARETPDGKESIVGLCTTEHPLGEAALFPYANYAYSAQAVSDKAELLEVPCEVIQHLMRGHDAFSTRIMAMLNTRTTEAQLQLEHMSTMSASQRLGCFLLRLCRSQHTGPKILEIPIEKHILATYLGMKPETFSRSLQQLKSIGVEAHGARITIAEIEKLRYFVCDSCSATDDCKI